MIFSPTGDASLEGEASVDLELDCVAPAPVPVEARILAQRQEGA